MSKRERQLKQRLDELFSTTEESEAAAADVSATPADQSPAPIEPTAPADNRGSLLAVIEQLPLPAYVKDHEHTWVAVNAAYGELIGHVPAKLIGHTDKEHADEAWQLDDRVLDTGQPQETQQAITLPDGSICTRRIRRTALFNEQHETQYVMGVVQESTPSATPTQIPTQPGSEDSQLKIAFESTVMGTAIVTVVDGRFMRVNQAWCDLLGYTQEEMLRMKFRDITHPDDLDSSINFLRKMLAGEITTFQTEKRYLHKNGTVVWVQLFSTLARDDQNQSLYFILQIQDIAQRKQSEAELVEHNKQLTTLNRLGQELTRSVKPEEVLELVFTAIGEIFDNRNLYITLYDEHKQEITYPIYTVDGERRQVAGRPFGNGVTEYILHTKVPLLIARDIQNYAASLGIDNIGRPCCCYLGVPLLSGDKAVGIIAVQDYEHEDVYTLANVELLSTIATQTAAALENTRLHMAEGRRALQLQTAAKISSAASTVLDVDELLPFVVNLIQQRFNLYYVGLFFVNETYQSAVLRAATGEAGRKMLERGHKLPIDNRSMIGWCIGHETARIALDVGEDAVRFSNPDLPETHSELALPLISRGQVLGAMSVQSAEAAAFSPQDITVLQTMADQVATAIANAQLLEQARAASQQAEARLREVQFLQAVGQAVSSTLDLATVLDVIFQTLEQEMGFTHAALATFDKTSNTITIVRASGTAIGLQGLARTVEQLQGDILLDILQKGETEVIDGWDDRLDREIWEREGHAALVRAFVPLRLRREPIGILEVGCWRADRARITPDEVRLLNGMADQMAIAVGNARLFDDSQRRITELAVVNEISRTLTSTQDVNQLFATIHQQVGRLFEASNFYIATYDGGDEWSLDYQYEHNQLLPPAKHKLGRGFTSYILETRQPLLIRSVQEDTAFHKKHDLPEIGEIAKSWMGVPLIVAGNVTGVMGIQSYEREGLYDEHNVALFSTIGTQAAAAIQNARLLQEARMRANELAALNELSRTLASQLSVNQVLEEVWHGVPHLLDTTNFYIALYDPERQEISFPINASESVLDKEIAVMPASQGLTGYIVRTRQPLLIKEDIQGAVNQLKLENVGEGLQSYLGVPIALGDQVLGVVAIQSYTRARLYNEHDQGLMTAIASQAAIALQNARLFEQTQKQAHEAEALSEIIQEVSQRVDLDHVLETAYRHISRLLPTDAFVVALLEGDKQLRYPLNYEEGQRFPPNTGEARPETLIGRVVLTGQPLLVNRTPGGLKDISSTALGDPQRPSVSLLYVPLKSEQKTIGAISVQSYQRNVYTLDNVALVERIANQLAIAIQNAQLFEETRQRNAELATLNQIISSATETLDLRTLLDMVLRQTLEVFKFDGGLITMYNEGRHKLERIVRTGLPGEIPSDPAEGLENSLCTYVFDSKQSLVIEDFRLGAPIDVSGEIEAGYYSYIGIPLEARGHMLGTWCGFRKFAGPFGKNTLTLLHAVSRQAAFAIENARLFTQTQATLAETERLYSASQRLTASTNLQEAVNAIAESVPVPEVNRAILWLFERDREGIVSAITVSVAWHNGQGSPPLPTGTRLAHEMLREMNVILTTDPIFSNDLKSDSRVDPGTAAVFQREHVGAIAILPLWAGGQQIGAFLLESEGLHTFTDAERRAYVSLSQQLATTIHNRQLLEQTQRSSRQLAALNDLGQAVSQQVEVVSVLEATYQRLRQLVPIDAFFAVLYDREANTVSFPVVYDEGRRHTESPVHFNPDSNTGKVIVTGDPILQLLTADELAATTEVEGALGNVNKPSASLLYVPLKVGAQIIGTLSIQSYQLNAYDHGVVQLMTNVANQVAISIQNARLLEHTRNTARREQVLRELTTRVRSSSDPDTIVRTAVRELGIALGRQTFIRLGDAEQLIKPPASPEAVPVSGNGSGAGSEGGQ